MTPDRPDLETSPPSASPLDRGTCILFGNCTAQIISSILPKHPGFVQRWNLRYVSSFRNPLHPDPPLSAAELASCGLLLIQRGHLQYPGFVGQLPASCRTVSFPLLSYRVFWPTAMMTPGIPAPADPGFPFGRFPYGDRLAIRLVRSERNPETAWDRYRSADLAQVVDLAKIQAEEETQLRELDRMCQTDSAEFVTGHLLRQRLFWTPNHPAPALLVYQAARILATLGFEPFPLEAVTAYLDQAAQFHLPIHPQIIRHFRLEWIDENARFRFWSEGSLTFEEYMKKYIQHITEILFPPSQSGQVGTKRPIGPDSPPAPTAAPPVAGGPGRPPTAPENPPAEKGDVPKPALRIPPVSFFPPGDFNRFTCSRLAHFDLFEERDCEWHLYGERRPRSRWNLKRYQDLLVFSFIAQHLPPGSRLLDVGGGKGRIIRRLEGIYECWNADKLEGCGQGPTRLDSPRFRLVRDYIGNFNPELPDGYFDFVFSISALEHVPGHDPDLLERVADDLDRVLKPGGYSLHCFDSVLKTDSLWTNNLLSLLFATKNPLNRSLSFDELNGIPDIFFLSEESYNRNWLPQNHKSYQENGRPFSYNILWRKPG